MRRLWLFPDGKNHAILAAFARCFQPYRAKTGNLTTRSKCRGIYIPFLHFVLFSLGVSLLFFLISRMGYFSNFNTFQRLSLGLFAVIVAMLVCMLLFFLFYSFFLVSLCPLKLVGWI